MSEQGSTVETSRPGAPPPAAKAASEKKVTKPTTAAAPAGEQIKTDAAPAAGGAPAGSPAPAAAAQTAPAPIEKEPVPIEPAVCRLAESARNIWRIDVSPTLIPPDLLKPAYWANVAFQFRHGDLIEAEAEDRSWYATYLVCDAGKNWARVAMLSGTRLDARGPEIDDRLLTGFSIHWAGNVGKWRVVRMADKKVIQDKFETKGAAEAWFATWAAAQLR